MSDNLFQEVATVKSFESISKGVYCACLTLAENSEFSFTAGQYLLLVLNDQDKRPFSIASAPQDLPNIELHIRENPDNSFTQTVIQQLQNSNNITIEGPLGKMVLATPIDSEISFIVGGTGFAPAKAMIENLLSEKSAAKVNLFWGAQNCNEIYALDKAQQWHEQEDGIDFTPVIFEQDNDWIGETGLVHKVAMAQLGDAIHGHEIYIAGSLEMVTAVYQDLLEIGIPKSKIHADILDILREQGELE